MLGHLYGSDGHVVSVYDRLFIIYILFLFYCILFFIFSIFIILLGFSALKSYPLKLHYLIYSSTLFSYFQFILAYSQYRCF